MSDAAIANIVTGTVTVVTMIVGFLTLWLKVKYSRAELENTMTQATASTWSQAYKLEKKLDANTAATNAVNDKTSTIVEQTNGTADKMRALVESIAERVAKIEEFIHLNNPKGKQ